MGQAQCLPVLQSLTFEPMGESAFWIVAGDDAPALASHLEAVGLPGVQDVVPAFDRVAVYFEDVTDVAPLLQAALDSFVSPGETFGNLHRLPVCFELGQDTEAVCERLRLSRAELVRALVSRQYLCRAMGFCPGFAYLGWIDERIEGIGRKDTPLLRVEPGSVAITGKMTAVYPLARPGGWWIVGHCPLVLVDEAKGRYPIKVGDKVQYFEISVEESERLKGRPL